MHISSDNMPFDTTCPSIEEWLFSSPQYVQSHRSAVMKSFDEADVVDAVEGVDYTMVPECKLDAASWTFIAIAAAFAVGGLAAFTWWIMTKM